MLETEKQHRADRKLVDLVKQATEVGRYMVTFSIWDEGTVFHTQITKSFPTRDMIPSMEHHLDKTRRDVIHGVK